MVFGFPYLWSMIDDAVPRFRACRSRLTRTVPRNHDERVHCPGIP